MTFYLLLHPSEDQVEERGWEGVLEKDLGFWDLLGRSYQQIGMDVGRMCIHPSYVKQTVTNTPPTYTPNTHTHSHRVRRDPLMGGH